MTQISAALSAGFNITSLLSLNFKGALAVWLDKAQTSGDYTFYGTNDSTASAATDNLEALGKVTVSAGQNEPAILANNSLANFAYLVCISPGSATLYVSGDAGNGASAVVSTNAPALAAYSAVQDLSSLSLQSVTVMLSKGATSDDSVLVYGAEDSTVTTSAGCVLLGIIKGGSGSGGTADQTYINVKGWQYLLFYREAGTTAGLSIKSAGVNPAAGSGAGPDVNPTPDTLVLRGSDGSDWNTAAKLSASGATVAATGRIKLTSAAETVMAARNVANSADVVLISKTGADGVVFGNLTNSASTRLYGTAVAISAAGGNVGIEAPLVGAAQITLTADEIVIAGAAGSGSGTGVSITSSAGSDIALTSNGAITIQSDGDQLIRSIGGQVTVRGATDAALIADGADAAVTSTLGNIQLTSGADINVQATGAVNITTTANNDVSVTPGATGAVVFPPRGLGAGDTTEIRLRELVANGVHYTGFKSPDALAANAMYALPAALPTVDGQMLVATTGGVMSWAGGVAVSAGNSNGQTITDGAAAATVTTWTETIDTAAAFDPATGVFTAPAAGIYLVNCGVQFAATAANLGAVFRLNVVHNAAIAVSYSVQNPVAALTQVRSLHCCAMVNMAQGDTITAAVQLSGAGGNIALTADGNFNYLNITSKIG